MEGDISEETRQLKEGGRWQNGEEGAEVLMRGGVGVAGREGEVLEEPV